MPKIIIKSCSLLVFLIVGSLGYSSAQQQDKKPSLFMPGLVSTNLAERDAALSPDGNSFYYSLSSYNRPVIVFTEKVKGEWSSPEVASFSGVYSDLEPHFSPDGNTMYFASNRPVVEGEPVKDFDIWYVKKEQGKWGQPVNLGFPVNTPANEFYPSITNNGTLYWCTTREDGPGGEDIFFATLQDGRYQEAQALPPAINTPADEYNAYIARDESYIIFTSTGWGKGQGSGDLWISFRNSNGIWTETINMGPEVNSSAFEFCPFVSDDGGLLFFSSNRVDGEQFKTRVTYQDIVEMANGPGNKQHSIYVMDAGIIEVLRQGILTGKNKAGD